MDPRPPLRDPRQHRCTGPEQRRVYRPCRTYDEEPCNYPGLMDMEVLNALAEDATWGLGRGRRGEAASASRGRGDGATRGRGDVASRGGGGRGGGQRGRGCQVVARDVAANADVSIVWEGRQRPA